MIYQNINQIEDIKEYMIKDALGIIDNEDNLEIKIEIKGKDLINFLYLIFKDMNKS